MGKIKFIFLLLLVPRNLLFDLIDHSLLRKQVHCQYIMDPGIIRRVAQRVLLHSQQNKWINLIGVYRESEIFKKYLCERRHQSFIFDDKGNFIVI